MAEIEIVKPEDIENKSFEIIEKELASMNISLPEQNAPVIKRVIHTTADFDFASTLRFSPDAVKIARRLIKNGADIITDTNMTKAGISKSSLARFGGQIHCFMADEDVAHEAKERGVTRALVSMERAAGLGKKLIFALGNAPTALISLYEMMKAGKYIPDFVIGVPVCFLILVAAKELFLGGQV
ncbi:MAG: precorrin-8X methylmutase, partial [Treponema sp.]|nr:precorrin-8X methylmutase [Treponema sp.]